MKKMGLATVLLAVTLGGCVMPEEAPHNAAERSAANCKADVERAYMKQNRAYWSEQSTASTPFSSTGLVNVPTQGLSDEFSRDQAFDQCLKTGSADH